MTIAAAAESIATFVRGSSQRLSSSIDLGWEKIAVEHHVLGLKERPETVTSQHIVTLASGLRVSSGERVERNGRLTHYSKPPGTVNIYVEGFLPAVCPSTQTNLIVCALDPAFVQEVATEQGVPTSFTLRERKEFRDESISGLVRLLDEEANSGGGSGHLYRDHLTYAFTLRLLKLESKRNEESVLRNSLSRPRLRRVLELMEEDFAKDIDLKRLAEESGYSVTHFLRMFRSAMGCTPFRYLSQLRVKKAQAMMIDKTVRLLDIGLACGFSSHAQLSRTFRQVVGVAPSEYRRNI